MSSSSVTRAFELYYRPLTFKKNSQAGEVAQWLRELATLAENQNSVSNTHTRQSIIPLVTPTPENLTLSSASLGTCKSMLMDTHRYTYAYT